MVEIGICEEVFDRPFIVNPLTVADTGKKRLVLDVSRTINPISKFKKVELGTLHDFNAIAGKGFYQAVMDVKSAYYRVNHANNLCFMIIIFQIQFHDQDAN